jgi:DNA-directed RNA polymerase specialized sigma24 family protein
MGKGNLNTTTTKNIAAPCPNLPAKGHKGTKAIQHLTKAQVRAQLAALDLSRDGYLMRKARYFAGLAQTDADDLLQRALERALTTRRCPAHLAVKYFVAGIMRSIASKLVERRESRISLGCYDDGLLYEGSSIAAPSPEDVLVQREAQQRSASMLERIGEGDRVLGAVIDGRGFGLRGRGLAEHAGIDQTELATVQRRLKRRIASLAAELHTLDEAA